MLLPINRLTFWLSNSIVLRAIISQTLGKPQISARPQTKINAGGLLSAKNGFPPHKEENDRTLESFDNWEDPQIFMVSLEKFEGWIFSRIVESVWWQVNPYCFQFSSLLSSSSLFILSILSSIYRKFRLDLKVLAIHV